ncbi:aminotransferase A [Niallia sp.]|uniref:aminotransferase A n=1 Tax=Niallia sp. TaxID=2837523 RepID=UPI00289E5DED|nr:aminotransferase A [Niallia sp.]
MEHLINKKVKNIEISGIRKFSNMVAGKEGMIALTIGQPDFPTPLHIKEAAKTSIDENYTSYTHNAGEIELRKAASQFVQKKYQLSYDPSTEVLVTVGASEAIDVTFRTILDQGVEVILPGPVYPGYEPIIRLCGAIPVYADIRDTSFRFTADVIKKYISEKTRCIVLPYPSNPTGVSLSKEELIEIAALLKEKDIFVLADEIYSELLYDQEHVSIAQFLRDQTIVINGLSKSHSMTGWRIGLLFAPSYLSQQIIKVHQYNVTCASSISQRAAIEALTTGINDADSMRDDYRVRRKYVYERLSSIGLDVVMPDGAFYFFIKVPTNTMNSFEFCLDLVDKVNLAVVPGSAFSNLGEGYFRISFAYSMETLEEACNRLEEYSNKYLEK